MPKLIKIDMLSVMRSRSTIIALRLSLISSPSWGVDFDQGLAAAKSGDFETALRE